MLAKITIFTILTLSAQQVLASTDCPARPSTVPTSAGSGPKPDGEACPTGSTCYLSNGADECFSNALSTCVDAYTSCTNWVANGFCTNSGYTAAQRAQYCKKSCNLCTTTTTTCVDNNSNCAQWVSNGFCTNTAYNDATRTQYCPKSCNLCPSA